MGREAPAVPRPRQCGRAATLETAVRERGPAAPKPNLLASYRQHCAWGDALPEDGARRHRRCFDFKLGFQWAWLCVFAALTASRLSFLCAAHAPPTRALITYTRTHLSHTLSLSHPPSLSLSLRARSFRRGVRRRRYHSPRAGKSSADVHALDRRFDRRRNRARDRSTLRDVLRGARGKSNT